MVYRPINEKLLDFSQTHPHEAYYLLKNQIKELWAVSAELVRQLRPSGSRVFSYVT